MAIYTQSDFEKDKKEKGSAFGSLYEKMQALEGSSGNRAAHVAAQETHSKGLRNLESQGRGPGDTSIFGSNTNPIMQFLGMKNAAQYSTPEGTRQYNPNLPQNPRYNYRLQPQLYEYQAPSPGGIQVPLEGGGTTLKPRSRPYPEGGFFPSLAGQGPTGAPGFLGQMGDNYAGMREAAGMGIANIASGGAFSDDPNVKMRKFLEQGFSPEQAQDYINATAKTNARLAQDEFVYGNRLNERGTQGTQATAATDEVDPTADPNYIPPHLRYLMEQREAVANMNMGGLMALGPMMQQQQYEMGRQMAMRDMGVSV
jgi:hypothetical protein